MGHICSLGSERAAQVIAHGSYYTVHTIVRHTLGGGPIHQTYETKRLASSTTLEGERSADERVEEGTDLVGSGGRAVEGDPPMAPDSEAGGGRDAMRYGGRARRGPKP